MQEYKILFASHMGDLQNDMNKAAAEGYTLAEYGQSIEYGEMRLTAVMERTVWK